MSQDLTHSTKKSEIVKQYHFNFSGCGTFSLHNWSVNKVSLRIGFASDLQLIAAK